MLTVMLTVVALLVAPALAGIPTVSAQEVVFLMRHAEQGPPPDLVLVEAGHRRAAALAHRLKEAGITAIFTTTAPRTQQTAAPMATALKIEPKLVPMQDIEGLVGRVRAEHPRDRVLIVNHALNIGAILKAFGHRETVDVSPTDYEPLFVIVPRAGGPPLVVILRL
jgi:broad specificity phosphatase PhoE